MLFFAMRNNINNNYKIYKEKLFNLQNKFKKKICQFVSGKALTED